MESEFFRINRWKCYWVMLLHQAPVVLVIMIAAIAGLTTAAFINSPWIGLASIGFDIFILVMGLTFVIAVYGFYSVTGSNMALHKLKIEGDEVKIIFEDEKEMAVKRSDLGNYRIYPGGVVVPVKGNRAGWLWVPPRAFESAEDFQGFMKRIYN